MESFVLKIMYFRIWFLAQELYYLLNIQWVEILGKTSIDLHFNVELWENLQLWILLLYNIIPFYPPISCPTVYGNENYTKFIECFFLSETLKNKFKFEKVILKRARLFYNYKYYWWKVWYPTCNLYKLDRSNPYDFWNNLRFNYY